MSVDIAGEGTEMKLEICNPEHRVLNLGVLKEKEKVKRIVPIVNRSLCAINFTVVVTPQVIALQKSSVLSVSPKEEISLKPQGTIDLVIRFHPQSRIEQFSEEVIFECAGKISFDCCL